VVIFNGVRVKGEAITIALYNDTVPTGDDDRLAITNQVLRELSGVNGLLVGDWIKTHSDEIITHNSKHGMQKATDLQRLNTCYNSSIKHFTYLFRFKPSACPYTKVYSNHLGFWMIGGSY